MIDFIGSLRWIYRRVGLIYDIVNATLRLKETGGSLTADGTEQVLVQVDAPKGVFKPLKIKLDMSNMDWGDTTVVRWYERITGGGGYVQKDEEQYDGPQDILPSSPIKNMELEPNRHGLRVTLQQTAGTNRVYPWEYLYDD